MSDGAALRLDGVVRTFVQGPSRLEVLRGASLALQPGEMVALVGPSGAGKSTLLHVAGLLERADGGEVYILGRPCGRMSDTDRTAARRRMVGFVYQYHHLLPEFSALENVIIPQMIAGTSRAEARKRAAQLLEMVGLAKRASHRPARLSGGEQQRVAIARALANKPAILLADEPTGNLDPHTAQSVFDLLRALVHEARLAALIATHNLDLSRRMDRVLTLEDGHVAETHRSAATPAAVG
jgi:lipoprotein-releasing system ATP-binding protein